MGVNLIDLNLLNDSSDSKFGFIRAKIPTISEEDIDLAKVNKLGFSKDSFSDWLALRYPVPLRVLKTPNALGNRIKCLCIRASNSKISVPKFDKDLVYFLGVMFGDGHVVGSIRKKGYRRFALVIQKKRTIYSEFVIPSIIEKIFGVKPKTSFWKRKSELITIKISSKIVSRFFTNNFDFSYGKKSDEVIDFVKKIPKELHLYFVAGLFDTDGGVSGNSFAFCNSSKKTALFVKEFLEKQKIKTRFYPQKKGPFRWYLVFIPASDKFKFLKAMPLKNESKYAGGGI